LTSRPEYRPDLLGGLLLPCDDESFSSQRVTAVPFVVGLGAAILLATVFGRWYWNRRVARWAEEQDLKLLECRGVRFYEGPRAFRRTESQFAFRVVVEDASGVVRTERLSFGGYVSIWPTRSAEILWDS
jgi:hypothetical protein